MSFILGFLGIVVGFFFILFLLVIEIKLLLRKYGFSNTSLLGLYKESKEALEKEKRRPKQVSGMTKVLLPEVLRDFKDFNLETFYLQVEKTVLDLFNSIEKKDITKLERSNDYNLLLEKVRFFIQDLKDNEKSYSFKDVSFHKHAIKSYTYNEGMATLSISTSLEYYYEEKIKNEVVVSDDVKRQTRFTTELVYIFDSKKAGFDIRVLGLECPNCGAAVDSLKRKKCRYCHTELEIQIANLLKCWKIVNVKDDYR